MVFTNLKTLFGEVMTSGQPVISSDPAHDPRRGGLPEGTPLSMPSWACLFIGVTNS
jgi:hypothetical protein